MFGGLIRKVIKQTVSRKVTTTNIFDPKYQMLALFVLIEIRTSDSERTSLTNQHCFLSSTFGETTRTVYIVHFTI